MMTCAFCGVPDATDHHHEEGYAPVPCCADAEACCERRMTALCASEVPVLEDGDVISDLVRGVPHSPMTPAIASAWSEEFVNETFVSGWWRQDAVVIPFPTEGRTDVLPSDVAA